MSIERTQISTGQACRERKEKSRISIDTSFRGGTSGGDKVKLMIYSRYISGVLLYFLLYSCATTEEPKFVVLTYHESFTRESTVAGKMGIGAFLSEVSEIDESRMFQYAELCRKIFLEERRDLAIVPLYVIFGQLGRSNYNAFLGDYAGYDTFKYELILRNVYSQEPFRYLLLVLIVANEVTETTGEQSENYSPISIKRALVTNGLWN